MCFPLAAEDARLRFTLNPPSFSGSGGGGGGGSAAAGNGAGGGLETQPDAFDQWLQAMRAAVRLPGGIPDELRRRVHTRHSLNDNVLYTCDSMSIR